MSDEGQNVHELFAAGHDEGTLSSTSLGVLTVVDLGEQIQAGLGLTSDNVPGEVTLVTMMPDDSGSIQYAGNSQFVCEGHNLVLDALAGSQVNDGVLVLTQYLNGHILNPYMFVEQAERMHSGNYDPNKGTPLFDSSVVLLGRVLGKHIEYEQAAIQVYSITAIISDGADQHSTIHTARDVASLVEDLLRTENHIVAGIGMEDPRSYVDFRKVFREMGIPDNWILDPGDMRDGNAQSKIRASFGLLSKASIGVSKGADGFSATAIGGFGS